MVSGTTTHLPKTIYFILIHGGGRPADTFVPFISPSARYREGTLRWSERSNRSVLHERQKTPAPTRHDRTAFLHRRQARHRETPHRSFSGPHDVCRGLRRG